MEKSSPKYSIVDHKGSGIKVFVLEGDWCGMFIIFGNFRKIEGKGRFSYEIAGLPSRLMHLLGEDLTDSQESSMMEMINEIATELFKIINQNER